MRARETRRRHTLNEALYLAIDQLNLYESKLIQPNELRGFRPDRLRAYYNRTGKAIIRAHTVADGIVVVRVE